MKPLHPSQMLTDIPLKCTHINPKFPLDIWTHKVSKCLSEKPTLSAPTLDQWSGKAKVSGFDIWLIRIICSVFPTVLICWYLTFSRKKIQKDFSFFKGKTNQLFSDLLKEITVFSITTGCFMGLGYLLTHEISVWMQHLAAQQSLTFYTIFHLDSLENTNINLI